MKRTIALAAVVLLLSIAVHAQICPGSHLNYYVRDAKGRLFDADENGLIYEQPNADPKLHSMWNVEGQNGYRSSGIDVPSDIATFDRMHKSLVIGGMCGFRAPVDLKLTLNGKVMELHFALPDMGGGTLSANFSVDSLPFTAGKYEIDMKKPTTPARYGGYGGYFAASLWKKVN